MALKISSDRHNGIPIANVYVRIDHLEGTKSNLQMRIGYYAIEESSVFPTPYKTNEFGIHPSVNDDAPNYHKQGYKYLKTLPEFETAIDV